ncbi:MAG: DUF5688 family protein [Eubacteriales bacterium]|nr:DUF5688 family protein [Eubacteriales bacterium]
MKYEEFMVSVKAATEERLGEDVQVQLHRITKNNSVVLDGMSIRREGNGIAPTIYLNDFYRDYQDGADMSEILDAVEKIYEKSLENASFDGDFYMDFENVRKHLACRIINRERNSELLKKIPHRDFLDLAAVVYYYFENDQMGTGTILVHDSHLKNWQVDAQELLEIARENTRKLLPEEFVSMRQLLEKYHVLSEEDTQENSMYVLTNKGNWFGAVYMMYDCILEKIGEKLETDFWILPSSIHECIIVPVKISMTKQGLEEMVREINRSEVDEEEFLSDRVYLYQRDVHRLRM